MRSKIALNKKKSTLKESTKDASIKKSPKVSKVEKKPAEKIVRIGMHNLKAPQGSHKKKKLLGRGSSSGHGKTSTRGSKGQTSRAGRDFYLGFEGGQTPLIRRIPKRGFVNRFKKEYQIVNLNQLTGIKESNITIDLLKEKGLIKDKAKLVKILGEGEVKNVFSIQAHAFSKSAIEKIKNVGGTAEVLNA